MGLHLSIVWISLVVLSTELLIVIEVMRVSLVAVGALEVVTVVASGHVVALSKRLLASTSAIVSVVPQRAIERSVLMEARSHVVVIVPRLESILVLVSSIHVVGWTFRVSQWIALSILYRRSRMGAGS